MTPQPQPAAYWIALLEELTGGIPFELSNLIGRYSKLSQYLAMATFMVIDDGIRDAIILDALHIESGQNVIDAAVELQSDFTNMNINKVVYQTSLYLRCNGIKR
jgi:hypothetical protein